MAWRRPISCRSVLTALIIGRVTCARQGRLPLVAQSVQAMRIGLSGSEVFRRCHDPIRTLGRDFARLVHGSLKKSVFMAPPGAELRQPAAMATTGGLRHAIRDLARTGAEDGATTPNQARRPDWTGLDGTDPPKPKWMRWRTFNRIMDRCDRYGAIADRGLSGKAHRNQSEPDRRTLRTCCVFRPLKPRRPVGRFNLPSERGHPRSGGLFILTGAHAASYDFTAATDIGVERCSARSASQPCKPTSARS